MSTVIAEIAQFLLHLGAVAVVIGPVVVLVELAHRRAVAEGRSVRSFPAEPGDADARRLAAELRAARATTAPQPVLRGRRHGWVSRDRSATR